MLWNRGDRLRTFQKVRQRREMRSGSDNRSAFSDSRQNLVDDSDHTTGRDEDVRPRCKFVDTEGAPLFMLTSVDQARVASFADQLMPKPPPGKRPREHGEIHFLVSQRIADDLAMGLPEN